MLRPGYGDKVRPGAYVTVHYRGFLEDDTPFDSSYEHGEPVSWHQGNAHVVTGFDQGVGFMREGERALIIVRSDYGYGEPGSPPSIPGNATIKFEVEVLSVTDTTADESELDFGDRIELARRRKEEGVALYRAGDARRAAKRWESAVELVEKDVDELEGRERKEAEAVMLSCHLNAAQALLKLAHHKAAVAHCDRALAIDRNSVKALYRRAQGLVAAQEFDRARVDLDRAAHIDPTSAEIRRELAAVKERERAFHTREKRLYATMLKCL
eukprot:tig00020537_g10250.t1